MNVQNSTNTQSEGSDRMPDVARRHSPDYIDTAIQTDNRFEFVCKNGVSLIISVLTDKIFRMRYSFNGEYLPDFSYAIAPDFKPDMPELVFEEFDDYYAIATFEVTCQIMKDRLLINFYDKNGDAICEDAEGFYARESIMQGVSMVKLTKKAPHGKAFLGLGDKAGKLNMRGKAYENWCTDAFGYVESEEPLYRAIPFYYGLYQNIGYGIFLDNTYRTRFSFDRKRNGVSSLSAKGGEMNYYFIYGPQLMDVSAQYMQMTGKPELPPLWALGFHQCKWSYYPESNVRDIAAEFRKRQIPCDSIYLDIDYMDGFRCFTWNEEAFPDPAKLVADLKADGFQTVVMIDPGIKAEKGYWVNDEGVEGGHFCKRDDGMLMKAPVWPENCHFPDFTNPTTRDWWANLYEELVTKIDVSGFWNDMNEPAVFKVTDKTFPLSVRHDFEGHQATHKQAHNVYGMQMTRASLAGIKKFRPEKRPFLLTRATFSGGQRFAAAWTGDNLATWEHLHLANLQSQRMSVSGFSFIGSDIGGFAENPDGELFVRWLQLAAFHPLMRVHSMGEHLDGGAPIDEAEIAKLVAAGKVQNQEPWSFGETYTDLAKQAIELRYQLLPYIYTAFRRYATDGTPIIQPLAFFDQSNKAAIESENSFIVGGQILVAPVEMPSVETMQVYFPLCNWYNYWTNDYYQALQEYGVAAPMNQIPFFIKSGTVLPVGAIMQYSNEKSVEVLDLKIYFKIGYEKSELYQDSGDGYGYLSEDYRLSVFEFLGKKQETIISQSNTGQFEPTNHSFKIELVGFSYSIKSIEVDGMVLELDGNFITVNADFKKLVIKG